MTILEVINKTTPFFQRHGVDSPRLTIELMLAHVLQTNRLRLYLDFERELDEATLARLRELVRRRAAGEPLQYVLGEAEFCGLKLAVDRRVLIPRPETEWLVEAVVNRAPRTVLDVGTGSGCIALAVARRLPQARVFACDVSEGALVVARENARRHDLEKNVRFFASDLLSACTDGWRVEAIVCNPPYISRGEWGQLPREVRDFEPGLALLAGEDGLEVMRRLAPQARQHVSETGWVALEVGAGQRGVVVAIFEKHGFALEEVVTDLQGHERVVILRPAVGR
ncbi:MAG: peptide chain release factor N(5)-glutamine methyltransferase [Verrucomicrobiae bacterium]|nr:peptide chain release factor N(5)-glutamine methyltransferase [Verrucomicrobiae bacterium]MDW8344944.1 peptide chain release factor N(5)-glutamine methyltransferase [Verrucomicrobiae bacterium]